MAITIRNKQTEAMIRRLGERHKQGPSAVIKRIAEEALERDGQVSQDDYERRMRAWDELMALAPPRDPDVTWEDIDREMQSLYDYLDDENDSA